MADNVTCSYDATLVFIQPSDYLRDETASIEVGCADTDIALRAPWSFDMSTHPAAGTSVTVTDVQLNLEVEQVDGDVSADTYDIRRYGDGTQNPATDTDQNAFNRCGSGTLYVSNNTSLRTTGQKQIDLTAAASDIATAILNSAVFHLAVMQDVETGGNHKIKIYGFRQDVFDPFLAITSEAAGGTVVKDMVRSGGARVLPWPR